MGSRHLRFLAVVLVVCLCVQHVQVKRIEDQQRAAWQRLRIEMDARNAMANPVLAAALATPAAPYVLSGLVLGTGALWCWRHGGKEAYYQMSQAIYEGVTLTKEKVQQWIAQDNGINTSGSVDLDGSDGIFSDGVKTYQTSGLASGLCMVGRPSSVSGSMGIDKFNGRLWVSCPNGFGTYYCVASQYLQSGFNPADYPELFNGSNLLKNCHKAAEKRSGLISIPAPSGPILTPPASIPADATVPPVYLVAVAEDGSAIDSTGKKWPPLPGLIPDVLNPPVLAPGTTGDVPVVGGGTVVVPNNVWQPVRDAGFPVGGTLVGVVPGGGVVYNPPGAVAGTPPIYLPLPPAVVASLPATLPKSTTGAVSGTTTPEPEQDPGDPDDPDFGAPPVFDTNFDWGQSDTYDINSHVSVVKNFPIVNLIEGSTLRLASADSVVRVHLAPIFCGPVDLSVDFDQWSSIWTAMGAMIYFIALINSISLAILGHKI